MIIIQYIITDILLILGALETSTIHIVPKNKINESVVRKAPMKILNQPFETTFRLQVRQHVYALLSLIF